MGRVGSYYFIIFLSDPIGSRVDPYKIIKYFYLILIN
jgi:hypothetical protein